MKKKSILFKIIPLILILGIIVSCKPKPESKLALGDDARKYAGLKCEMRQKIMQMQNDSTKIVSQAEIDSLRKVMNTELKKIRLAYESDSALLKKFEAAVISEQGKLDECRDIPKPGKQGRKQ